MPVERRGWVTHGVCWVNGRPEELSCLAGRRQPSLSGTSRMRRESHVRICERLGVRFPGPTRRPGLPFQLAKLRAHGRCRAPQPLRRAREAAKLDAGGEGAESQKVKGDRGHDHRPAFLNYLFKIIRL